VFYVVIRWLTGQSAAAAPPAGPEDKHGPVPTTADGQAIDKHGILAAEPPSGTA
jgi:hypothetical protein